jgi:hypothetical protein
MAGLEHHQMGHPLPGGLLPLAQVRFPVISHIVELSFVLRGNETQRGSPPGGCCQT